MRQAGLLFVFVLAARLCHSGLVWVEEAYPAAAAIQILYGKVPYRDFWFDKPPLTPLMYLLWGAYTGVALRIAGAIFVGCCCWAAYRLARDLWSEREAWIAAGLLAFFLTFDVPSSVMAIAPDLFMILPHLVAIWLAWRGRAFASGAVAGAAMLANPKAVFVLAACLIWAWRDWARLLGGFVLVNAAALGILAAFGALQPYYEQVWAWGAIYSRDSFIDNPLGEGLRRTGAWVGFHGALVIAAVWCWRRERRFAAWAAIAFCGVVLGWRFFPRYYFLLLPAVVIGAARGFTLLPRRIASIAALLLLIPFLRFGPRYAALAGDLLRDRETQWADIAMGHDSRAVSNLLASRKQPGDTLLVWGYRPDIFMETRIPAGTPFLDSQPLTGVIADRHLVRSDVSAPELAAPNRARLAQLRPTWIVDGLGPYNPALAITKYPDLAPWLAQYEQVASTDHSIVYRLRTVGQVGNLQRVGNPPERR